MDTENTVIHGYVQRIQGYMDTKNMGRQRNREHRYKEHRDYEGYMDIENTRIQRYRKHRDTW